MRQCPYGDCVKMRLLSNEEVDEMRQWYRKSHISNSSRSVIFLVIDKGDDFWRKYWYCHSERMSHIFYALWTIRLVRVVAQNNEDTLLYEMLWFKPRFIQVNYLEGWIASIYFIKMKLNVIHLLTVYINMLSG